ncbi:MAG: acylhydrolase [Ignavibacteriales bacterium]|nr:MAG: acylhydrolase [Ignavibacteriales bacterium]
MKTKIIFIYLLFLIIHFSACGQENKLEEFADFNKYAEANEKLGSPKPGEKRVVFMGNSITEFWAGGFFSENKYINRGISGQTTPQMLLRFRNDVINLKPDLVVILAGINDIAENTGPIALEDIFGNIVSMTQLAEANGIKVILCSVLPAYDFPWNTGLNPLEKIIKLNEMIKLYCEQNNIPYVDYYSSMVDERKGLDKKYSEDGVHPNLSGYKVMEPIVKKAIKKLIKN